MIDQDLLARLDQWHDENQHKQIIQEIEAQPEESRLSYELQGRLARAYNNVGKYAEAIRVLEGIREQGKEDDRWWSRMGYALYQQGRYGPSRECFLRARELNPDNQDARTFLGWLEIKVNGMEEGNGWKEEPDRKPRPQPPQGSNGWQDRAAAPRPPKPKETDAGNGWEQKKAPAQGKPRASGSGNDWEGRGWEGTALLETTLFGVLRFPVKEGLFETLPLTLGGKPRMVDLYITEGLAEPKVWEPMTALLNAVPEMYRKGKERIAADHRTDPVMELFIREQLAEMDGDALTGAFGAERREEITPEAFAAALEPRGITLAPAGEGKLQCAFDFSLDPEITDELLVIRFDQGLEITDISHES